ncbi:AAA family ATPase [Streptomyces sp. NPDC048409]|uniref:AAA family ATPase n=1 Tax=Streptomyces sp. NPDC048409 TaxID=3154723 RepID=UPI00344968ED
MKASRNRHEDDGPGWETFVGRAGELRRLRTAAEGARTGTASMVLVQGVAGVGKTELVRRFLADLADPADHTVLSTTAEPDSAETAFDCLTRLTRRTAVPVQARRTGGEEQDRSGARPAPGDGARHALRRLTELAAAGPVVVFLDDAQWADRATLHALADAVRAGGRLCVLLAARRSPAWDEETQRLLQSTRSAGTIDLREFAEAEATAFVTSVLGAAADRTLVRGLLERSGCHPLYLATLTCGHPAGAARTLRLPAAVVQRQLRGVPPAAVRALSALAVLGGTAPMTVLGRMLGAPDCGATLDTLAREGLTTVTPGHVPSVTITHPALGDALYDGLPFDRRRALHLAAAWSVDWRQRPAHRLAAADTADARLVADVLDVVRHDIDDGRLLPAARLLASTACLSGDDRSTDHLLYGAVRLMFWAGADTELGRYAETVSTRRPSPWRDEALGLAEFAAGRLASARRLLERACDRLPRRGRCHQRAALLTELAMVQAILGQGEATRQSAERALQALSGDDTAVLGEMESTAVPGGAADGAPGPDAPARSGDATGESADTVLPPGVEHAARVLASYATALRHGPQRGLALLATLPEDPDEIREEDVAALTVRGILRLADGRLAAAANDLTIALARTRPGGARLFGSSASLHLATCHLLSGEWDRAAGCIDAALRDGQSRSFDVAALWSLRSVLHALRGDAPSAAACLAEAEECARRLDFAGPRYHTAMARAMGARARGDHAGVVAVLQVLAEHLDHSERVRVVSASWLPFLAESLIVCGLADEARAALKGLRAAVPNQSNSLLAVVEAWLQGRLAEAADDAEEAARRYEEAIEALSPERDIPLLRGLVETSCGRVTAASGRLEDAAGHFASAEAVFSRLGARALLGEYRTQRRAALPDAGRMARQDPLTGRERQVTELVVLGHSNQEIADELTLSVKTVEYHLRNIFCKLEVRNRRELRRRVTASDR